MYDIITLYLAICNFTLISHLCKLIFLDLNLHYQSYFLTDLRNFSILLLYHPFDLSIDCMTAMSKVSHHAYLHASVGRTYSPEIFDGMSGEMLL